MTNADRYWLEGHFGARSASNNTSACRECGAVVYDTAEHDLWHDRMDSIAARAEA